MTQPEQNFHYKPARPLREQNNSNRRSILSLLLSNKFLVAFFATIIVFSFLSSSLLLRHEGFATIGLDLNINPSVIVGKATLRKAIDPDAKIEPDGTATNIENLALEEPIKPLWEVIDSFEDKNTRKFTKGVDNNNIAAKDNDKDNKANVDTDDDGDNNTRKVLKGSTNNNHHHNTHRHNHHHHNNNHRKLFKGDRNKNHAAKFNDKDTTLNTDINDDDEVAIDADKDIVDDDGSNDARDIDDDDNDVGVEKRENGRGNTGGRNQKKEKDRDIDDDDDDVGVEKRENGRDKTGGRNQKKGKDNNSIWFSIEPTRTVKVRPQSFPSDYIEYSKLSGNATVVNVLDREFNISSLRRPTNLTNELPYLGVLLDAGRHYFPVDWIKRMIHVLSIMNFNYLHFRLTDDQTFNVQLKSQPLLAYPTTLNNNTRVYTPEELRGIVRYAKSKGIDVIPEINVPGHGAAWGGIPDLILQCPKFICEKGYGVPLNINHPNFRNILKDVLEEVIEIFDNPPYLHLGGDEVNMAKPCFEEIGETFFDYSDFETLLRTILAEIRYDESNVIRWEMSEVLRNLKRAGDITHFWFRQPGSKGWNAHYDKNYNQSVFLSCGLYFDTNEEDTAYEVYVRTKRLKHNQHPQSQVLGIVGGTFELSTDFWLDRNVIGRLLAVSMGVSGMNTVDRIDFLKSYKEICLSAGFPKEMCSQYGVPPIIYAEHRKELKGYPGCVWHKWIENTCNRLTDAREVRVYKTDGTGTTIYQRRSLVKTAKNFFFDTYYENAEWEVIGQTDTSNRLVNYTGVIMDIAKYPLDGLDILRSMLTQTMAPMGLNMIQLRLVTDFSFAYFSAIGNVHYPNPLSMKKGQINEYPLLAGLRLWKKAAAKLGIEIMPELSISTNAGGMYKLGFHMECPIFHCEYGRYIPQNISDPNYLPIVYSLVRELVNVTSSPYIHLGHDQREISTPCFLEASNNRTTPNFDHFETKLRHMLSLVNITSDRVVRWENKEKTHYPTRFGDITQCVSGETCGLASSNNGNKKSPWFGTVDVRKGGAFQIYSKTRDIASRSPIGILAEIGSMREDGEIYKRNHIDYRLLAFSLGTLDMHVMNEDEFEIFYLKNCMTVIPSSTNTSSTTDSTISKKSNNSTSSKTSTESHESLCRKFAKTKEDAFDIIQKSEEKLFEKMKDIICEDRTEIAELHFMKDPSKIATAVSMQQAQVQAAIS